MSSIAVLVYLLAIGIAAYLMHHFQLQAWYWHAKEVVPCGSFIRSSAT